MRSSVSHAALTLAAAALWSTAAWADITSTVNISTTSGNTTLAGGTLVLNESGKTYTRDFTFKESTSSTIDAYGNITTLSGVVSGDGNITFADSVGSGTVTLSNSSNDYTGTTTINSGVTLALIDSDLSSDSNTTSGTIEHSQLVTVNGTLDISGALSGRTLIALAGSGNVVLGSNTLTLYDYDYDEEVTYATATTFSGVISGSGGLTLSSGEITLTGVNTLTGSVTVSSDTLHLTGDGSIANAGSVVVYGKLDAEGVTTTGGVSFKSLTGSGTLALGTNDLTLTNASGVWSGTITGTGLLTVADGTQWLGGTNSFTNVVVLSGAELQGGSETITYAVANSGIFTLSSSSAIAMSGVISGTGDVEKDGVGIATISTVQTYTGTTTINSGTIKLSGAGSIAQSSNVENNSYFDLTAIGATSIKSLSGIGTVRLGTSSLTITEGSGDFSGDITGTGTLTVSGGTQSLSGASTYTGATSVTGGTLKLVTGASLKSAVTVSAGATLDISSLTTTTGSATIVSLSGDGDVNLGGNTLVLSSASGTFYGVISGTGGLWIGGGSETLTGANTYTGTTTVSAGTLTLTGSLATTSKLSISGTLNATGAGDSATGTLTFVSLAGTGTVNLGGHALVLNTTTSTTFSGVLTGTAGLTVSGSGTQILSGSNTYTGGTTIDSGATLQIGSGASTGAIIGDVEDNGTLKFYRQNSYTFAGTITGTGDVIQAGIGTTILTGTNTYTGTTTISAGTLQIGDGTTTGSIDNTDGIVNNGTLAFSPAAGDTVTINTAISGYGGVSILTGTVVLTSDNSYTGVTRIADDATLALTNTSNITASSAVTINGTLDLSGLTVGSTLKSLSGASTGAVILGDQYLTLTSATTTFAGVISGSGGLILTSGTQVLSGTSSYTGATTVNGGTLSLTGSIANSAVTVNSGGTLSGAGGTVGSLTVASGGTVIGAVGSTLTSNGDVTLASGSTYTVSMTSTHSTSAVLYTAGTATVTGTTLTVASSDGTFDLGNQITILSAGGGITGTLTTDATFTGSDVGGNNDAVFRSTLTKSGNVYYLEVNLDQLSPALPTTATTNQKQVAAGIDAAIAAGSTLSSGFENLGNDSESQLLADTSQLTGEIGADVSLAAKSAFDPFLDMLSERSNLSRSSGKGGAFETWIGAYGGTSVVAGDAGLGANKFHASTAGAVLGAQYRPWSNVLLGGAVAFGRSNFRVAGDLGSGSGKSVAAGVYGRVQLSRHFYNSFLLGLAANQIETTRSIAVSGDDTLAGKLTAVSFGGRYEAGMQMRWFTPYIAVQDQYAMLPGYTETAAAGNATFAMTYGSRSVNSGRAEVGFRHQIDVDVTPRWILTPDFTLHLFDRLAYTYNLGSGSRTDTAFATVESSDFSVYGAKLGRHGAVASVGADVMFDNGLRLTTHIDTVFTQKSEAFTGSAGVSYTW